MKVLILRFSSIGDIVLTTPVVRILKKQLGATVHYATKPQFRKVLEANPYIDRIHVLDGSLSSLTTELAAESFGFIADLHHNLRTKIIKMQLRVPSASFDKLNVAKWLMVNFKINTLPEIHIVDRYLKTILPLGVTNDLSGLDYFIPPEDEVLLATLPESHRDGYTAYALGGQHATKRLPIERMIELCRAIGGPIILLGGKEDVRAADAIAQFMMEQSQPDALIYNGCGQFNLNQSASLVKQATKVFTHDTGLMHIAAAFKKPTYAIWGNTIPAFGMYPYQTEFHNLENTHLSCRPCSKIGYEKCPKGHFKCMRQISFDSIRIDQ